MRPDFAAPVKGLLAGVTGTVAMTLALRRVFPRALPPAAQRGLLPERVVEGLERRITGELRMEPGTRRVVTMPAHYAYGAGCGVAYGLLRAALPDAGIALLGAAWGLAVWAGSYEVVLPAADVVPRTTERPPAEWIVPIAAHLVFGVATAYAFEALSAEPAGDLT